MNQKLVKRKIFEAVYKNIKKPEILLIIGPRQTGKTTLLSQIKSTLLKKNITKHQIKTFNLDLISDLEHLSNQSDFISYLKEELNTQNKLYIFIDEVQKLKNPGLYLKGIYDLNLNCKFIVTGSSNLELRAKVFESLTGRKKVFHLLPFDFQEYISYYNQELSAIINKPNLSKIHEDKIKEYFNTFLTFGGYPKVATTKNKQEKIEILEEIYSSYIEKDIIAYSNVKNPLLFSKLITILASQIGNLLNLTEIQNTINIDYRTLDHYISILENTFIVTRVKPYYQNIRKELSKMPKIFFIDNGIRNFAIKNFISFNQSIEKGALLENYIFSQLKKNTDYNTINYWRTKDKNEIDFILKDYFGNIIPIEVKAKELTKPIITSGIRHFIEKYNPKEAKIINLSLTQTIKQKNTKIHYIKPY